MDRNQNNAAGIYPQCRRESHWTNKCKSKTDIQGHTLSRNERRAQSQAPKHPHPAACGARSCFQGKGIQFLTYQSNHSDCWIVPQFHQLCNTEPRNGSSDATYRHFWSLTYRNLGASAGLKQHYYKRIIFLSRNYNDYTEEIKIMVDLPHGIIVVPANHRNA